MPTNRIFPEVYETKAELEIFRWFGVGMFVFAICIFFSAFFVGWKINFENMISFFWMLVLFGGLIYLLLSMPFRADINENQTVEFHSYVGRMTVPADQIKWVWRQGRTTSYSNGRAFPAYGILICHNRGFLYMNNLEDFPSFMATLRSIWPGIEWKS